MLTVMSTSRNAVARFFRNPETGELAVWQPPNAAILVWLASRGLALFWDERDQELRWVGSGALIAWALDELIRGASPFRRTLGAVVLGFQVYVLVR